MKHRRFVDVENDAERVRRCTGYVNAAQFYFMLDFLTNGDLQVLERVRRWRCGHNSNLTTDYERKLLAASNGLF